MVSVSTLGQRLHSLQLDSLGPHQRRQRTPWQRQQCMRHLQRRKPVFKIEMESKKHHSILCLPAIGIFPFQRRKRQLLHKLGKDPDIRP